MMAVEHSEMTTTSDLECYALITCDLKCTSEFDKATRRPRRPRHLPQGTWP